MTDQPDEKSDDRVQPPDPGDQRDENRDDRVQRGDEDAWRTTRREEIDPYRPLRRDRFRDDYDEDDGPSALNSKVRGPALAMIIVGWLGLVLSLGLVGLGVAMPFMMMAPAGGQAAGPEAFIIAITYGGMGLASAAANVVVILGGTRMRQCRSWGLAMTAAILCIASILVYGLCGAVVVGFGIWALVVLVNSNVKREFDRVARQGTREPEDW